MTIALDIIKSYKGGYTQGKSFISVKRNFENTYKYEKRGLVLNKQNIGIVGKASVSNISTNTIGAQIEEQSKNKGNNIYTSNLKKTLLRNNQDRNTNILVDNLYNRLLTDVNSINTSRASKDTKAIVDKNKRNLFLFNQFTKLF